MIKFFGNLAARPERSPKTSADPKNPARTAAEAAAIGIRLRRVSPLRQLNIPVSELSLDKDAFRDSFVHHVQHTQGKHPKVATKLDKFYSLARTTRDRLFDRWTRTWQERIQTKPKHVYYLSLEYLLGRLMSDSLHALGVYKEAAQALSELGIDIQEVLAEERDPGLGNGGLGRLAACFMDSMATLGIPAIGYGMRYDYGIFRQDIIGGEQHENPDLWLQFGTPWEVARPERIYDIHFGGRVIQYTDSSGRPVHEWVDTVPVRAMAYDYPLPGYGNDRVNTLRLWGAKATREFDIHYFNAGDYMKAVERQSSVENITRVLYPNDHQVQGKELRLKQQYFLVSATLQDALRRHLELFESLDSIPDKIAFQLNDTHPALAVAELMRLLCDQYGYAWGKAWEIVRASINYTNHTLMPEALEKWPVWLLERVLPRHLQIIYQINHLYLEQVRASFPGDEGRIRRMSVIGEEDEKTVRMGNLAVMGSGKVNGVSALHSRLLREMMFKDFNEFEPGKFTNQTNGVTPRRWLLQCNPELAALITDKIGSGWVRRLDELEGLVPYATDPQFQRDFRAIKLRNKQRLAAELARQHGIELNPEFILDSQVKRLHEYKRQLLNILHVVSLYLTYRQDPGRQVTPRTFLFAGKAAPGYEAAKRIIHLINTVARVVNADPVVRDKLQVVFVPNYNVTWAELIMPATEVSEQISTAGMEASGTGNMKFALNGALTIGTLDGANVEIREAVGAENFFLFGLTTEQVLATRAAGYDPQYIYHSDRPVREAVDAIRSGFFLPELADRFQPIVNSLLHGDHYLILADFLSYKSCHEAVLTAYGDADSWTRKAILNVANMGPFSSDRTILGYSNEIWGTHATTPPNGAR